MVTSNKLFLTVDVECHDIANRNLYLDGKIGNEYWGLKKILDIGKIKNIPINFFINVVECRKYGDDYIAETVKLIREYNQPIYLHIHPSYVTQDGRPMYWQYNKDEKESTLMEGVLDFQRLVREDVKAFRAGSYSADDEMYRVLNDVLGNVVDLSYCENFRFCHYNPTVHNKLHKIDKVSVLPNTRFVCFKLFGKKKHANLDIASANYNEMKRVLEYKEYPYMVCTMHPWYLFKHFFYKPWSLRKDRYTFNKFIKFIECAKRKGWEFSDFEEPLTNECDYDQEIDLCKGFKNRVLSFLNTFLRMQRVSRTNKKYFLVYSCLYSFVIAFVVWLIILVI